MKALKRLSHIGLPFLIASYSGLAIPRVANADEANKDSPSESVGEAHSEDHPTSQTPILSGKPSLEWTRTLSGNVVPTFQAPAVEWAKVFSGATGSSVQQTNDGGFIIAGSKASPDHVFQRHIDSGNLVRVRRESYNHAYLLKTDSLGNKLWEKMFAFPRSNGTASSVLQTKEFCKQRMVVL